MQDVMNAKVDVGSNSTLAAHKSSFSSRKFLDNTPHNTRPHAPLKKEANSELHRADTKRDESRVPSADQLRSLRFRCGSRAEYLVG